MTLLWIQRLILSACCKNVANSTGNIKYFLIFNLVLLKKRFGCKGQSKQMVTCYNVGEACLCLRDGVSLLV